MPNKAGGIIAAIIGAIAIIVASIISGQYLLAARSQGATPTPGPISKQQTPSASPTTHVVATPSAPSAPTPDTSSDFGRRLTTLHLSQTWSDAMASQSAEQWDDDQNYCTFQGGAYLVTHPEKVTQTCYAEQPSLQLNAFAFEARMTILDGNGGGILFGDKQGVQYYFTLDHNGYYTLYYHPHTSAPSFPCDSYCTKPGIAATGYHQPNLLGIIVDGTQIEMYINRHLVYSVQGVNIPNTGTVGVLAIYYDKEPNSKIQFQNATVWL